MFIAAFSGVTSLQGVALMPYCSKLYNERRLWVLLEKVIKAALILDQKCTWRAAFHWLCLHCGILYNDYFLPVLVSAPSVVWALPVWNMVVRAVLQYEPGRQSGSTLGHCASAVLRLEDYPDRVRHFLCSLLSCLPGVCKEWAKRRWPAQHPASSQEGGEGRWAKNELQQAERPLPV